MRRQLVSLRQKAANLSLGKSSSRQENTTLEIPIVESTMASTVVPADQPYDLLILTDATASMGSYLRALNTSLPEIIRMSTLTGCFDRIGVVAYRDYCGGKLTEWSGWYPVTMGVPPAEYEGEKTVSRDELLKFCKGLDATHGGDWPEATKTGLHLAYQKMRADAKTIMLLYTDAPPHLPFEGGKNLEAERKKLLAEKDGKPFVDWVCASNILRTGEKKAQVFPIVQSHLPDTLGPYMFLSHRTGGRCFRISDGGSGAKVISKITMEVLLSWMGVEKEGSAKFERSIGKACQYVDESDIDKITSEDDRRMKIFMVVESKNDASNVAKANMVEPDVNPTTIKEFVQARVPAMTDFSKRYVADEQYRKLAVDSLYDIVSNDVTAVTVNPVFGSLWRTICNDRLNPSRDTLIQEFGLQVDKIADADKKAAMKLWLEESYNYAAELLEILESVPEDEQYPCIFLDPTIEFKRTAAEAGEDVDTGDEAAKDPTKFTRMELLEIGRSCAYPILRRMGRVLTRLTYAATADDMPAHIAKESQEVVPRIPLALVQDKHKRKFWKVLLHTILPGTMITARPAALLAALSLRMGIQHLRDAADTELLQFADKWNNLEIPETWNTNCLALVLDADANYESRVKDGITQRAAPGAAFLSAEDRRLFNALVDYKLLEMNLNTTLTARVGWRPEKTMSAMGPVVKCKECLYPRSVTIMAANNLCGHCVPDDSAPEAYHQEAAQNNVRGDDCETTQISWVECSVTNCRAQYVVYNPQNLNVRAKCFYCRFSGQAADDATATSKAPLLECKTCTSRVIYPVEYRPEGLAADNFTCPACDNGKETVVDAETTAQDLIRENGTAWLLRNDDAKIPSPLNDRSLHYTVTSAGTQQFADKVAILPALTTPPVLTLRGKRLHNMSSLIAELHEWIASRRAQGDTCSLCFTTLSKRALRKACGRRGCTQQVCTGCMDGWYGLNTRGAVLNIAALSCPFCRRQPVPGAIKKYGLDTLGGLATAVAESGEWVYAWCWDCGLAKRFVERVCANGPPAELVKWQCDVCESAKGALKVRECPGCGVTVEKMGGCDHIECTCGVHWCWECGKECSEDKIYEHMCEVHGGMYGGQEWRPDWGDDVAPDYGDHPFPFFG